MRFLSLTLLTLLVPLHSFAATLYLSPASGTQTAGKAFTVNAYVSSPGEAMNAVSGTLTVDSSLFSIVSASSAGSIVNFWVQEPSIAGNTVSFEGVVLNPGYQGSGGKIASLVLMPKGSGAGAVSFSNASVLANDGQGTNILNSTSGGSFTVQPTSQRPVEPEEPEEEEEQSEEPLVEIFSITDYDSEVVYGDLVAFRGTTHENANIAFAIYGQGALVTTEYATSNANGDFSLVITKRLVPGSYEARITVTRLDGETMSIGTSYAFVVKGDLLASLNWLTLGHLALFMLGILAAVGALTILHAIGWRKFLMLTHALKESQEKHTDMTAKVFTILKKDIAGHVKRMQSAGKDRVLTEEEIAFLKDFAEELDEAEKVIRKKRKK